MSLLAKFETLLDETIGLVRDVRAYVDEQRKRGGAWPADLFGPRGTEIRFDDFNPGPRQGGFRP